MSNHTRIITVAAILLLASTELEASVVNHGYVNLGSAGYGGRYAFSGDDFSASGGLYLGNWEVFHYCSICTVGTAVGVYGIISGSDISNGGWFEFFGPPVVLLPGIVTGDFMFNGWLCLGDYFCSLGTRPITGSGSVEIESRLNPYYVNKIEVQRLTYVFSTPEPSMAPIIALALSLLTAYRIRAASKASRLCKSRIT